MATAGLPPTGPFRVYLRQITYGGNDGIITTFAIVAGFTGAEMQGIGGLGVIAVLVFGIANLTADGVSMGLGEFLSGRSARDLYQARHAEESARLADDLAGSEERLAYHLAARGLNLEEARHTATHLSATPQIMADLLVRYEDGLEAPEGHNAPVRALMTFMSFLAFGLVPLLPYLIAPAAPGAFRASLIATALALTLLGLLRFAVTRESLVRAVGETLVLGGICALVAWSAGMGVASFG